MATSQQLRVLHITRSEELGIRAFLSGLLTNMDRDQFHVTVAGPLLGPLTEDLRRLHIAALRCPVERDIKPIHDSINFVQICTLIARERPDILHLHGAKAGFLGRIAGRLNGVPAIVYTPNNDYLDDSYSRYRNWILVRLERWAARLGGHIVSVTAEERQSWLRRGICMDNDIVTIHDGFDFSRATPLIDRNEAKRLFGIPQDHRAVGMIARLVEQKAPHIFVEAAAQVLKVSPDVHFLLVGDGPLKPVLEELTRSHGISHRVQFLGFVGNLSAIYSAIEVSVLTSLYEGLPMVILESMYLGIPIVVSQTHGVDEVVAEGCGLVTPIRDTQATAHAILAILRDQDAANLMATGARTRVLAHFGAAQMAERYQQLYARLVAAARAKRSVHRASENFAEPNAVLKD
jgi:glycosyltransferase involved in cell wall biosynthesis